MADPQVQISLGEEGDVEMQGEDSGSVEVTETGVANGGEGENGDGAQEEIVPPRVTFVE